MVSNGEAIGFMEIEKTASAVSSVQNIAGAVQSSSAQNSQIEELQRLADSIRKIENDCRITARVQGLSGTGLQMKLRQYDELLSKVNQQIRELQRRSQNSAKRFSVSMLKYNTDAARAVMGSNGKSISEAINSHRQSLITKSQSAEAQRKAEQSAKEASQNTAMSLKNRIDVRI
jgi:hypothetical protein